MYCRGGGRGETPNLALPPLLPSNLLCLLQIRLTSFAAIC